MHTKSLIWNLMPWHRRGETQLLLHHRNIPALKLKLLQSTWLPSLAVLQTAYIVQLKSWSFYSPHDYYLLQSSKLPILFSSKAEASTVHMTTISCSPPNCQYCSTTKYSPHPLLVWLLLSLPEQINIISYNNKGGWVGTKQTKKSDNTDSNVRSQTMFDT